MHERALAFACGDDWLYGILSLPQQPAARGVLIVVGGPQYRAGSHRQFTLLARALAQAGTPVLRFDYRGMGDSEGALRSFEEVEQDLRAALDRFFAEVPGMREVVLWGLCDGATASALYAPQDSRVTGLALLNPWVRTEQGEARAMVRHYYRARLLDPGLWKKIVQGRFAPGAALRSLWRNLAQARGPAASENEALPERMRLALARFRGRVLVLLSGADLTAQEFADLSAGPGAWRRLLDEPRMTRHLLAQADHTLSRRCWHDEATALTSDWLRAW